MVIAVIAAITIFVIIFGKKNENIKSQNIAPYVQTYELVSNNEDDFKLTGTVHARVESDLGFRVSGKIIKRLVNNGQYVRKGQPLMVLDAADLALIQSAAQSSVAAAKAENTRAILDEQRQGALVMEQAVSRQEYELAKATAASSSARLLAAQANAKQMSNQVQYATLRADVDGVVTGVEADIGQVVAAGQPVIKIAQSGNREAVVFLPETKLSLAKNAKNASLYSDASQLFTVTLRELSAVADPVTRSYEARYILDNSGQEAPLGSTISVSFASGALVNANSYRVPIGAIYDNGNGSSVWVVDTKTLNVHVRPVKVIDIGEGFANIAGNLAIGDRIVALGVHLLKDNQKVRTENTDVRGK